MPTKVLTTKTVALVRENLKLTILFTGKSSKKAIAKATNTGINN